MAVSAMLSACGTPEAVDIPAEREALRAAAAAYHAAAEARDTSGLAGLYSDAAVVLPPGEAAAAGMAAVREFVTEFAATPGFAVSVDDTDMTVDVGAGGDMGYTLANVKVSVTGTDGAPVEQSFRDFHLWEKQDGEWRLAVDIWNSEPVDIWNTDN